MSTQESPNHCSNPNPVIAKRNQRMTTKPLLNQHSLFQDIKTYLIELTETENKPKSISSRTQSPGSVNLSQRLRTSAPEKLDLPNQFLDLILESTQQKPIMQLIVIEKSLYEFSIPPPSRIPSFELLITPSYRTFVFSIYSHSFLFQEVVFDAGDVETVRERVMKCIDLSLRKFR